MKHLLRSIFATLMLATVSAVAMPGNGLMAQTVKQTKKEAPDMNVIPDKTIKTDDGIRITVCLVGLPHTSQRIDGVDLLMGSKLVKANDIDGVDFERYFQFEDEGIKMIDIDFPFKGTLPKTAKMVFHTVKGDITTPARQ